MWRRRIFIASKSSSEQSRRRRFFSAPSPSDFISRFLSRSINKADCFYRASAYWRAILTRDIDIANLSVRPSVRLSVPVSDENGLTYRQSFFSPYCSPIILVLPASNIFTNFRRGHCGALDTGGVEKKSRFSTNKSLYLANDTKYLHSYYGRRIGTCMRSIKWCHFQWPWTNPNPVFKVTPLFDAKYLTNCYSCHSYYRRRIGNRTQAFEWHQLQWLWVTSNPHFKVTIIFSVK